MAQAAKIWRKWKRVIIAHMCWKNPISSLQHMFSKTKCIGKGVNQLMFGGKCTICMSVESATMRNVFGGMNMGDSEKALTSALMVMFP